MSRIGVDVDGVLADFNTSYIDLMIKSTGKNLFPLKPFDIPTWNYPEHYGYTKEEVSNAWKIIKENPHFWVGLGRYAYTKDVLDQLTKADNTKHEVYFITTRVGVQPKIQTTKWLIQNGFFGLPSVIISSNKGPVAAGLDLD